MTAYPIQVRHERKRQCRPCGLLAAGAFAAALLLAGAAAGRADQKTLLFFGDSLTAGYGVDPGEAFPALIADRIEKSGRDWRVVNAGLSGETSAGGLRRLDWILRQPIDIFVLELGANDGLRGIPPDLTFANLQKIIDRVKDARPGCRIVLAGMRMPTNMGEAYTEAFAAIYPALAKKNDVSFVPFLLEGVGGVPALNQADGIHPTAEGHRKIADTVWRVLAPLL